MRAQRQSRGLMDAKSRGKGGPLLFRLADAGTSGSGSYAFYTVDDCIAVATLCKE